MNTNALLKKLKEMLKNPPEKGQLFEYHRKIKRYKLSPIRTEELCDLLLDRHVFFPTVAEIATAVSEMQQMAAKEQREQHWVTFNLGEQRYCMRCHDPSNPPAAPAQAYDIRLVVANPVQDERCSRDVGRGGWLQGWRQSGAPEASCMAMFERPADLVKRMKP